MSGCLAENILLDFVEGRLSTAATGELHRHVDGCPSCRALLREVGGAFFEAGDGSAGAQVQALLDPSSLSLPAPEPSATSSRGSVRADAGLRRSRRVSVRAGARVGKYRAVRQIGVGGMGVVFEALHEQLRRRVAIKVLYPHYSENPQVVARLLNEARAANIVRHPAIVNSFEVGHLPGGEAYLVMEYLDGESLRLRMGRLGGRLGPGGLRILRQIASALGAAHGWGVVHRDLKPGNVMLVRDPEMAGGERVKILDFGLAKVGAELREEGSEYSTQADAILGTPAYMAPEQCQEAAAACEKADVYSLGVILFEAASGRLPFSAKGAVDLMAMHIYVAPPGLREVAPEAPEALVQLVARMLAKTPAERPTMAEVAAELERLETLGDGSVPAPAPPPAVEARPRPRRRLRLDLWLYGAAAAATFALGVWVARPARTAAVAAPAPVHLAAPGLAARRPATPPLTALPPPAPAAAAPVAAPQASAPPEARPAEPPRRAARRPAPPRGLVAARPADAPAEDWTDDKIRIFH